MLSETMADVRAGRMDPRVGSTVAYIGATLLRTYEADPPPPTENRPSLPLIYRSLIRRDGTQIYPPDDVLDLNTGKPIGRIGPNGKVLPLAPPTVEAEVVPPKKEDEVEILDL